MIPSYTAILQTGPYSSENAALFVPRKVNPAKRAIFYAHGAGGSGAQALGVGNHPAVSNIFGHIALEGFVVISGDFGGPHTYGNSAEVTAMETAWTWLKASGLCATDKIILTGGSMGMLSMSRFAADHPTWVAGINGWIPAIDIEDIRNRNVLGLQDQVNTAWGLPLGSSVSTGGAQVPTAGRPLDRVSSVDTIPTHLWYSTADTAATSSAVTNYLNSRTTATGHVVSTTLDHGDAAIGASDIPTILSFLDSVA